jgi:hypothetical protein
MDMTGLSQWSARAATLLPLLLIAGRSLGGTVILNSESGPGRHGYQIISDKKISWSQAEAKAAAEGGYLATSDNAGEQKFLEGLLSKAGAPTGSYWFGLQQSHSGGPFAWINHDPLTYTHWVPGTPDNANGNETVGTILWSKKGQPTFSRRGFWNDAANDFQINSRAPADLFKAGYIVEFLPGHGAGAHPSASTLPAAPLAPSTDDASRTTHAIPLPTALYLFPAGAAVAVYFARRMSRKAS